MNVRYRMSKLAIAALFLWGIGLSVQPPIARAQTNQDLKIGDTMPMSDRAVERAGGGQISLRDAAGENGTLVVFWSNDCPWVDRYEDRLLAVADEYGPKGIGIIAVNPNDPTAYPGEAIGEMQALADQAGYPFPYVVDEGSALARAFGASRTPEVFLFDGSRQLVYRGAIDDNPRTSNGVQEPYLRRALNALLSATTISDKTSKPFGCTIKWP